MVTQCNATQFLGSLNALAKEVKFFPVVFSQFFRVSPAVGSCDGGESRGHNAPTQKERGRKSSKCSEDDQTAARLTIILPCTTPSPPQPPPPTAVLPLANGNHRRFTHQSARRTTGSASRGSVDHLTEVTGPPGDDDGVRLGVRLVHKLHLHVIRRVDVMLADLWVFPAEQIQTRPRDATWGEDKRKRSTYCARKSLATPSV